jgi:hypothetical protein
VYVNANTTASNSSELKTEVVACDQGDIAIGGGGFVLGNINVDQIGIVSSGPLDGNTGTAPTIWTVTARELDSENQDWALRARLICATP